MNDNINYYDLLNVKRDATEAEIKKAYITQIKRWHPDLNKDPKAEEISKRLNEAKEVLLDETKRKEYDYFLDNKVNEAYSSVKEKYERRNNTSTSNTSTTNNKSEVNNTQEEKSYTKWEYFKLYIKYYKINIFRKILGIILVLIESLICSILQLINIIITYTIVYLYEIFAGFFIYGTVLYTLYFAIMCIFNNAIPTNTLEWVKPISIITLFILGTFLLPMTPGFLINKMPVYITKLNMFLFKKSIGYKN